MFDDRSLTLQSFNLNTNNPGRAVISLFSLFVDNYISRFEYLIYGNGQTKMVAAHRSREIAELEKN